MMLYDEESFVEKRENVFVRAVSRTVDAIRSAWRRLCHKTDANDAEDMPTNESKRMADLLEIRAAKRDPGLPPAWAGSPRRLREDDESNAVTAWRNDLRYAALVLRRWSTSIDEYKLDEEILGAKTATRRRNELQREFMRTWSWIGREVMSSPD